MKKFILLFLAFSLSTPILHAQEKGLHPDIHGYITLSSIPYRESGEQQSDYMKERCLLELYYPENVNGFPVIVWFHGGGLTGGEPYIPELLKNKGIAVIAVGYRLSPAVHAPAYIEDAAAAVAWAFRHIAEYGGDPNKIIVSGHSAGGYLTSMVGLDPEWLEKYGINANDIALLAPFSGHTITHFTVRAEQGIDGKQPLIDEYAPLWYVRPDAPPLLLITGDRELEMLGRYEENAYLWRMMNENGHEKTELYEMKGFNHGSMVGPACLLLLDYIAKNF